MGNALVDAILGKGAVDSDLRELKGTILRLEQKIDYLTRYVIDVLPGVIYDGSLLANLRVKMEEHRALHLAVEAQLAAYRSAQTATNENQLVEATRNFLVSARTLTGFGAPYYAIALQGALTATAVFTRTHQQKRTGQDAALQEYGRGFAPLLQAWLRETPESTVQAQLKATQAVLQRSTEITSRYLPSGVVHHFVLTA